MSISLSFKVKTYKKCENLEEIYEFFIFSKMIFIDYKKKESRKILI